MRSESSRECHLVEPVCRQGQYLPQLPPGVLGIPDAGSTFFGQRIRVFYLQCGTALG
jgi:hypothetical protein